ncbi:NUT family member 2G [Galemys pyrenaicus]|uniref:NUT family member 2G n=1 Tax=Galemys pyrenaicus TaxID=202257 RepID=A0A8J6E0G9_GALPY|nr:NUT family member 2G [Galemys pyrenaicus]KAG8525144.1 NUT family member 2G [Galemys pyrenaicus]KAG8525155.1 NUT family member 2G [Galemys pyrenaicus]
MLGLDLTVNPGPSMLPLRPLPFPTPGLPPLRPWEPPPPPLMTPVYPPANPLVMSAFPRPPLVAGAPGHGPQGTGPCNVILQVRSEGGPVVPPQTQTFVLSPAPLNWSAPGTFCGAAGYPAPLFLAASTTETMMPAPTVVGTQAGKGGWPPGLPAPAPAPPPAAQLAPVIVPANAGPWPRGACREAAPATTQSKASPDDSCNPKSVYENFRRWQRFKALARMHLPQSPDAEALSCFLIPVLRSLARLKPTMTLEEGLWRAVQEWQTKSNFDRMIFYEMAAKFMEFEAEEELQMQNLQSMKGVQCLPPPAPPQPDSRGPPAPPLPQQPACSPRKAGARVQAARQQPHRPLRPRESKAPKEVPPEAVNEYVDIMEALLGPLSGAPLGECPEKGNELQEEEEGNYPDPGLLSYIDHLCSQQDFVTKVEAVIHPRFLLELLSPEPELDLLALAEELEQEEGLNLAQLVEKRLSGLKEEGAVLGVPSHGAPSVDSRSPTADALGSPPAASGEGRSAEPDCKTPPRAGLVDTGLSRPRTAASSSGQQEPPPARPGQPSCPPQSLRYASSGVGSGNACILGQASAVRGVCVPADGSSEDEEELPSLAFLLASQHSLLPWGLAQSPVPASATSSGRQGARQFPRPQRRGLSAAAPRAAKSRKRPLCVGPAPANKTPLPGAEPGVSARPALALGLLGSSLPQKRRCDPLVADGRRRKRHCSQ